LLLTIFTACSGSAPAPKTQIVTSHAPPTDLSQKFSSAGQKNMQLVPDHLLGKDFMPGGNLAEYQTDSGEFQLFLLEMGDAKAAAFMLLDWKNVMPEAQYIAHMGGYFGHDKGKPVYVFSKGQYLAGVIGLPEQKADVEARRFAERL
jgi:hypothetical protein